MIINKNSLIGSYKNSNNQTITIYLADYITECERTPNKYWDADSGRNLAKTWVGSFDIFTTINCHFKPLNQQEMEIIEPLLNAPIQNITYYDPELKRNYTMETYSGNFTEKNKRPNLAEPFNIQFIARKRRT